MSPIRILICDDHTIFREGFKVLLNKQANVRITGEAENGRELVQMAGALRPHVIVTDIKMPVMDGIEATQQIKSLYPDIEVIALSMFGEEDLVADMMLAGAKGYLLKNATKEMVLKAIETVYNKCTYCGPHISLKKTLAIMQVKAQKPEKVNLSEREIKIIKFICKEYSSKEIAAELNCSPRTIDSQRERIAAKLQTKNIAGIIIYAIKNGLHSL